MSAPSLISSVHGPIRRVLFAVPYWVLRYGHQVEIQPYKKAYEALLTLLPAHAERVLVTHAEAETRAADWLEGLGLSDRSRVVTVSDDLEFTVWAQDSCVVQGVPDGESCLVAPSTFDRYDDASVLEQVSAHLGIEHRRSELSFQGGNVLVGDDFWLLGEDAIRQTLLQGLADDASAAEERFAETLDAERTLYTVGAKATIPGTSSRPLSGVGDGGAGSWEEFIHIGSHAGSSQPLFDLDAFVSLAGRDDEGTYRVLVGDPRMASEITETPLPDHGLAGAFDEVAERLTSWGFRVIRNPLPLVHHDDPVLRTRRWYFASSNNVVAEIDGESRQVWLPTYRDSESPELELTDRRNEEIWRRCGFEVHLLPSFHVFARGLGAAHCICKCLSR